MAFLSSENHVFPKMKCYLWVEKILLLHDAKPADGESLMPNLIQTC